MPELRSIAHGPCVVCNHPDGHPRGPLHRVLCKPCWDAARGYHPINNVPDLMDSLQTPHSPADHDFDEYEWQYRRNQE